MKKPSPKILHYCPFKRNFRKVASLHARGTALLQTSLEAIKKIFENNTRECFVHSSIKEVSYLPCARGCQDPSENLPELSITHWDGCQKVLDNP